MNEYTPDLELRRRVIKTRFPNQPKEVVDVIMENSPVDISFDAIMPLVRGLPDQDNFGKLLKKHWHIEHKSSIMDWLIFEATPADYCRAYLAAAKGERDV